MNINTLTAPEGCYLTQIAYDIPIEERVFGKKFTGVKATYDYFRIATDEEVKAWNEYKIKQEEYGRDSTD
jgi:hypothetical protein